MMRLFIWFYVCHIDGDVRLTPGLTDRGQKSIVKIVPPLCCFCYGRRIGNTISLRGRR